MIFKSHWETIRFVFFEFFKMKKELLNQIHRIRVFLYMKYLKENHNIIT